MAKTIVKIGQSLRGEIPYHGSNDMIEVNCGSTLVQITKVNDHEEWKVSNAVNGYGINCYDELKNENVELEYKQSLDKIKDSQFKTYLDSDEPLLVMIKKTGHVNQHEYHVIWEDPFESKHQIMTKYQIEEKFKIKL